MSLANLLSKLNPYQREVAAWRPGDGDMRVVACAGAGKTATTVALVGSLLKADLKWNEIVVTTFTARAAAELQKRLAAVVPYSTLECLKNSRRVGTFHALALRVLRDADPVTWEMSRCLDAEEATRKPKGTLSSSLLWRRVLTWGELPGLLGRKGLDLPEDEIEVREYELAYDVCRSRLQRADHAAQQEFGLRRFADAAALLESVKRANGWWDFQDALLSFYDALESKRIDFSARVVVVDEAQDNTALQIRLADLIGEEVIQVGDGRQSIFRWRGASPNLFIAGSAPTKEIPTNYRSGAAIVEAGNAIAQGAPWAAGTPAKAMRDTPGRIRILGEHADAVEEADAVADEIKQSIDAGEHRVGHFAVLCRTNAATALFEAALVRAQVPCHVVGGSSFFTRAEVLDAFALMRLGTGRGTMDDLRRVANKSGRRFLGRAFLDGVADALAQDDSGDFAAAVRAAASNCRSSQRDSALRLAAALTDLRSRPWRSDGAAEDLPNLAATMLAPAEGDEAPTGGDDKRGALARSLAQIARSFPDLPSLEDFGRRCAGSVKRVGSNDGASKEETASRVTISTIHRAKGLEWEAVYVSANAGTFPHRRSGDHDEERRLFYVAVTRARDVLTLTWACKNERGKDAGPSPFLSYIPGADVVHPATPDQELPPPQPERVAPILDMLNRLRKDVPFADEDVPY